MSATTASPEAIKPVHTAFDGDTLFAMATGERGAVEPVELVTLMEAGADCVARAIVHALLATTSVDRSADGGLAMRSWSDAFPSALTTSIVKPRPIELEVDSCSLDWGGGRLVGEGAGGGAARQLVPVPRDPAVDAPRHPVYPGHCQESADRAPPRGAWPGASAMAR